MRVISDKDCFFGGFRKAGAPFDFEGDIKDYPYLRPYGSSKVVAAKVESSVSVEDNLSRDSKIIKAIESLDRDNDDHWTTRDDPDVKAVEEITGFNVTRKDIKTLCPGYTRY